MCGCLSVCLTLFTLYMRNGSRCFDQSWKVAIWRPTQYLFILQIQGQRHGVKRSHTGGHKHLYVVTSSSCLLQMFNEKVVHYQNWRRTRVSPVVLTSWFLQVQTTDMLPKYLQNVNKVLQVIDRKLSCRREDARFSFATYKSSTHKSQQHAVNVTFYDVGCTAWIRFIWNIFFVFKFDLK